MKSTFELKINSIRENEARKSIENITQIKVLQSALDAERQAVKRLRYLNRPPASISNFNNIILIFLTNDIFLIIYLTREKLKAPASTIMSSS